MLPYQIAFLDDDESFKETPIDIVFNVLLAIDIVLNFFSAYLDNEENVVKNRRVTYNIDKLYFLKVFFVYFLSFNFILNNR